MRAGTKYNIREYTLKNGLSYPSNKELIMLILGNGVKGVSLDTIADNAIEIINNAPKERLLDLLSALPGLGKSKALALTAAIELGKRLNSKCEAVINGPKDIIPYLQHYALEKKELFLVVTLNGARNITSIKVICSGSGNFAILNPFEIFYEAVKEYSSAIIICHNHPSGNDFPSQDDITTTKKLLKGAQLLGISLLDHIIITKTSYYSFSENNMLL